MSTMPDLKRWLIPMAALTLAGCSVFMSANRQTFRCDPSIIQPGVDRATIDSTCGQPDVVTNLDSGKTKAIYKIDPNAVRAGTKAAEVGGNVVADVLTLGLWEIVSTPIEVASQDKITNYIVTYGSDQKVETVEAVK